MAHPIAVSKLVRGAMVADEGLSGVSTQEMYREILSRLGEDPDRDGLRATPERVEKAMAFLTKGYDQDPGKILRGAMFDVDYDEMVIVKDIEMFSLCEHHMLPFLGKVHVAYIPKGKVIGLSKIPRLVDVFARRLQVQERLTQQIADCIQEAIAPQGVGGVIEARRREAAFVHGDKRDGGLFPAERDARGVPVATAATGHGDRLTRLRNAD